jgi:hypothetical protein
MAPQSSTNASMNEKLRLIERLRALELRDGGDDYEHVSEDEELGRVRVRRGDEQRALEVPGLKRWEHELLKDGKNRFVYFFCYVTARMATYLRQNYNALENHWVFIYSLMGQGPKPHHCAQLLSHQTVTNINPIGSHSPPSPPQIPKPSSPPAAQRSKSRTSSTLAYPSKVPR